MANNALLQQIAAGGIQQPNVLNSFAQLQGLKMNQEAMKANRAAVATDGEFRNAASQFLGGEGEQRQSAAAIMQRLDPERFLKMQEAVSKMDESERKKLSAVNERLAGIVVGVAAAPNSLQVYQQRKGQLEPIVGPLPDFQDEGQLDQFLRAKAIELGAGAELLNASRADQPKFGQPKAGVGPDGKPVFFATDQSGNMRTLNGVMPPPKDSLVNINMGSEKEQDKAFGKFLGETAAEFEKNAISARSSLQRLNVAEQAIERAGTGAFADTRLSVGRILKATGVDVKNLSDTELLNALQVDFTLDVSERTKGAVTDREMALFAQAVPSLQNTKEGNKLIVEMMKRMRQREIEVAKMSREYARQNNGRLDRDFFAQLDQFGESQPTFEPTFVRKVQKLAGLQDEVPVDSMSDEEVQSELQRLRQEVGLGR